MRLEDRPSSPPTDLVEILNATRGRLGSIGSSVLFFTTIGSTNDVAATLAAAGDREGAVVIADEQSAGRGRRGHTWFSPPGSGLYVSVVLRPARARVEPDRAVMLLTLAAGVALAEAVETATALRVDLKWPNDLVAGGRGVARKVAGILAEGAGPVASSGSVVLGYGINVRPTAYPPDLGDRATSLESELGRRIDRAAVLGESLAALARRYDDLLDGRFDAILDAWRARAPASHGARVSWNTPSGNREGVTAGIDDRGALLVRVGQQMERIVSGELVWH